MQERANERVSEWPAQPLSWKGSRLKASDTWGRHRAGLVAPRRSAQDPA